MSKLKIFVRMLSLSKKPEDYGRVERLRRELLRAGYLKLSIKQFEAKWKRSVQNEDWFLKDSELIQNIALGKHSAKKGSLGDTLRQHFQANKIPVDYFDKDYVEGTDKESIYTRRILETHDCWHALLGVSTDRLSEMELQCILYQQTYWPTAPLLMAGYVLKVFFESPKKLPKTIQRIFKAWNVAERLPNLYLLKWSDIMDRDIEELRIQIAHFD